MKFISNNDNMNSKLMNIQKFWPKFFHWILNKKLLDINVISFYYFLVHGIWCSPLLGCLPVHLHVSSNTGCSCCLHVCLQTLQMWKEVSLFNMLFSGIYLIFGYMYPRNICETVRNLSVVVFLLLYLNLWCHNNRLTWSSSKLLAVIYFAWLKF